MLQLLGGDTRLLTRVHSIEPHLFIGQLIAKANSQGMTLEPKGRLADPLLVLGLDEQPENQPGILYPLANLPGKYAAHGDITDFYPAHAAALKQALESGHPFDSLEAGAKKEIEYARVQRLVVNGPLLLKVRCEADDGIALADTSFWEAAGGNAAGTCGEDALRKLGLDSDQAIAELENLANLAGIGEDNQAVREQQLPAQTTWDALLQAMSEAVDSANDELEARAAHMTRLAEQRLAELKGGR